MILFSKKHCLVLVFILLHLVVTAQVHNQSWKQITESNDENWFASKEAIQVAENVLLYQRNIGGWPKNIQMHLPLSEAERQKFLVLKNDPMDCTIDNGATCQELLFLSKIYKKNPDERYKTAFLKGLDYLLEAQYDNGGWPQFFPLIKGYYSHITYNDDAMVGVLELLKELKNKSSFYSIVPSTEILQKVEKAFNKGIDCILKTQHLQNGVLTSWCAQHDEFSLLPAKARAYELLSLSGKESAKITLLLMSIENPSQEIIAAVEGAVQWFEKIKINGIEVQSMAIGNDKKEDKVVVKSPNAQPLWARFMDLNTNIPFFCDRDGIKKATLAEIGFDADIPETGTTLTENALIKARHIYAQFGQDCFADDSGLEVDALYGEPGVFSARYAGEPKNDENNIDKLIANLNGIENKKANFKTVICLNLQGEQHLFTGIINGKIIEERMGTNGFGYDPIFVADGYQQTFAELTLEEKARISHRGIAVQKLIDFLH